jgi:hypothetical protein
MISNSHDELNNSKLALLEHRFVAEMQQVTGEHFPGEVSVVCTCCPDKSGKYQCVDTVILCRRRLVEWSNLMFDNCKF